MKDKTSLMNMRNDGAPPIGEGAENGFQRIPDSEVPSRRAYKKDQLEGAALWGNEALTMAENPHGDEDSSSIGGFLPRNNYSDRF